MTVTRRGFIQGLGGASAVAALGLELPAWAADAASAISLEPAGETPVSGGTLNVLINPEPPVLSTFATTAGTSLTVSSKVLEGLLSYDADLTPRPALATEWSVDPDGLAYRFTLRPGVRWHDGEPFVAADVALSIDVIKRLHPRGSSTFAHVERVETPDGQHVVLHLNQPAPYMLRAFAGAETPILPAHLYAGTDELTNPWNNKPIGTGPWRFKQWERGSHLIYERNPDYWAPERPYPDTLIYKVVPDSAARIAAFQSGALDLGAENPVPLSEFTRLASSPGLASTDKGYNYGVSPLSIEFNLDHPLFSRLEVRQAIAHALDREVIKRVVYYGFADVTLSPISQRSFPSYAYSGADPYPFDIERANTLLDQAGLPRRGGGQRFSVTLDPNPYSDNPIRTAAYVRSALARIGIQVNLRAQDFPTYIKRVYTDRDFDFIVSIMNNTFDPTVGVQRLYWSKNFRKGVPFSNGTHYDNPEVDRLLEAAAVENDDDRRAELFKEFQRIVIEEIPSINLVMERQNTLYRTGVHGFADTATGANGAWANVWLARR